MNDAPVDIGIVNNLSNPVRPILGTPLPVLGTVAFLDHKWSDKFTSSITSGAGIAADKRGVRLHSGPPERDLAECDVIQRYSRDRLHTNQHLQLLLNRRPFGALQN